MRNSPQKSPKYSILGSQHRLLLGHRFDFSQRLLDALNRCLRFSAESVAAEARGGLPFVWLAVAGYSLGALSKPFFAIAPSAGLVLTARMADRVGKGLRGAAFGLRQSLDTVGAFAGRLLAFGLMLLWANDFRSVFRMAVIPGTMAVLLLAFGVREPEKQGNPARTNPISMTYMKKLSRRYWWVVAIGALFTLARFSEAFLVLRAMQGGACRWRSSRLSWLP